MIQSNFKFHWEIIFEQIIGKDNLRDVTTIHTALFLYLNSKRELGNPKIKNYLIEIFHP